jgi:hypothetical protein
VSGGHEDRGQVLDATASGLYGTFACLNNLSCLKREMGKSGLTGKFIQKVFVSLNQGSQTKIDRKTTFQRKNDPRATVIWKKATAYTRKVLKTSYS